MADLQQADLQTAEPNGADVIVEHLIAEGVPYLFGLCGHGIVGLMEAARTRSDRISTVSVHNEQIAGFAADAYFRLTGRPGATFTSCGPGSVNIQMAIANAMFDSSAVLAITGNIPTQQFNKGPFQEFGHHHQADFVSAMRPYVKRSYQATRPDMLASMMRHAFGTMLAGRPGPVHLDVPFNVFLETAPAAAPDAHAWRAGLDLRSAPPPEALDRALDLLAAAERPLILAGHGCLTGGAGAALAALAQELDVPVATTPQGKGVLPDDEALHLGPTGRDGVYPANRAARGADVVLALGTRFGDRGTSSWHPGVTHDFPPARLIHVDCDPAVLGRNYPTSLGVVADAALFCRLLRERARARAIAPSAARRAWLARAQSWKTRWQADVQGQAASADRAPMHPARVVAEIAAAVPDHTVLLSDIGAHHSWCVQQMPMRRGGRFLQSGGGATMGFGVGGAIGAQFAMPDRPVVAVVGDGGMLMHASAIATAVEYELPVVWVVWNNCGYVSIRDLQRGFLGAEAEFLTRFRNMRTGELRSTDFAALARAMGAQGVRAEAPADLGAAIAEALRAGGPTVIDAAVSADAARMTAGSWDMPPVAGPMPNYDPDPVEG
ncbi:thiamine pyrophosphate-binding protein [Xanthobacter sp. KR7-225]|uniref:thiamine pyrophosphate-binding protein n=1 Tax=Xanthobacter sp. KR7-225 TaxID=3156613 RepID=UPI0032B37086